MPETLRLVALDGTVTHRPDTELRLIAFRNPGLAPIRNRNGKVVGYLVKPEPRTTSRANREFLGGSSQHFIEPLNTGGRVFALKNVHV